MKKLFRGFFAAGAVVGIAFCADAGHDLHINGNFYGGPTRTHIAPGWTCSPGGVRFFPGSKPGKQILELVSHRRTPKIAVTELHRIGAGVLEVKADVSGRGFASLGFEAYDSTSRRLVQNGKQSWQLTDIPARIKFNFPITDPAAAFVRITLTSEPGSIARFADVEAEMKYGPAPVAPVAPVAPPPPVAPLPPPVPARALVHGGFYNIEDLPHVSAFHAAIPAGKDIDFRLSEHPSRRQYWSVVGNYDTRICRIETEHKHKHGRSYIKIELNAMFRGTTNVEFVNPAGKRVIVQFTSL